MTRKLIILFAVSMLCFYSLISSFLGERGILVNKSLTRQLKENEYELDRKEVEIENLAIQEKELSTEDGLRSAAMNLGYKVESDDVYVFPSEDQVPATQAGTEGAPVEKGSDFKPWSTSFTLLISFCCSTIITVLVLLFSRRNRRDDDPEQVEPGDSGDDF